MQHPNIAAILPAIPFRVRLQQSRHVRNVAGHGNANLLDALASNLDSDKHTFWSYNCQSGLCKHHRNAGHVSHA